MNWPLAIILTPIALLFLAVREYRRAMDQFELAGRGVQHWSEAK